MLYLLYTYVHAYVLEPPVIDRGSFVPRPSVITRGNRRVKIGSPAYVRGGYSVFIDCNSKNGTRPIHWNYFRNGSPYPTDRDVSDITVYASNGDNFECRIHNNVAYDIENTTVYVEYGKCVYVVHTHV